ncbi:MAG: TIGR02391 family protein [Candidatus Binatia bacterium]
MGDAIDYLVARNLVERLHRLGLSKYAVELLSEAAAGGGEIVLGPTRDSGQAVMVRGRRTFSDDDDHSVQARYRSALKELIQLRLAEHESGVVYRLTGPGWDAAQGLQLEGGAMKVRPPAPLRAAESSSDPQWHPLIAAASRQLYRNGHYSNAVFDASKALIALVKEKSGKTALDGAPLMRTVFSPKDPNLAFNDLRDQSDRDEQEGMMHLFEGAVLALRNPRGHSFLDDSGEVALECIIFLSMLANRLELAKRLK